MVLWSQTKDTGTIIFGLKRMNWVDKPLPLFALHPKVDCCFSLSPPFRLNCCTTKWLVCYSVNQVPVAISTLSIHLFTLVDLHLHPNFCPLQSCPAIGGLLRNTNFGDALGTPPAASPVADAHEPHKSDQESDLPNDPIGDFACGVTPRGVNLRMLPPSCELSSTWASPPPSSPSACLP
jgi:hypothetical protein